MIHHETNSKSLNHNDDSGFEFAKEMLDGHSTAAINFDRLQKHPQKGYIIFEYLLCDEKQIVSPYTSHPNRYWRKNSSKFLSLWRVTLALKGTLYLVNYAHRGTKHEDEILLIEVQGIDSTGITKEIVTKHTRESFRNWFIKLNNECLSSKEEIIQDINTLLNSSNDTVQNFV